MVKKLFSLVTSNKRFKLSKLRMSENVSWQSMARYFLLCISKALFAYASQDLKYAISH